MSAATATPARQRRYSTAWPARGVRFDEAIAQVPLTLPSHASILTGVTPLVHGVRDNAGFVLGPSPRTVAEAFRDAGYDTAAFVSGFPVHHRFGLARGFATYDDRFPRGADPVPAVVRRAAGRRDRCRRRSPGFRRGPRRRPRPDPSSPGCTCSIRTPPTRRPSPWAPRFATVRTTARLRSPTSNSGRLLDPLARASRRASAARHRHLRPRRGSRRARRADARPLHLRLDAARTADPLGPRRTGRQGRHRGGVEHRHRARRCWTSPA